VKRCAKCFQGYGDDAAYCIADGTPLQDYPLANVSARPKCWYCMFCGRYSDHEFNNYYCSNCQTYRPFMSDDGTRRLCDCKNVSLFEARYCEWCGKPFEAVR
jgi:hypothetical protein